MIHDHGIFLLAADIEAQKQRRLRLYRQCLLLLTLLRYRDTIRTRNYATTNDLIDPSRCGWYETYRNGSNEAFISLVGLNRNGFHLILKEFSKHYVVGSGPGRRGRPPKLPQKHLVLAMVLHFYVGTIDMKYLGEMFGVPPSTLARIFTNAEIALNKALRRIPEARIVWPSFEQQKEWAELVNRKEPLVKNRWGFIDGKNYPVEKPSNVVRQNAMYNGWMHAVLVTGTICLGADGTIVWWRHNCPGSWNDGETSRRFREKLLDPSISLQNYGVVADSAFPVRGEMFKRIITPIKEGDLERTDPSLRLGVQALSNAITSIRQAAEWGMGSVEKCFKRLKLALPVDRFTRKYRLENIHRLYNVRTRTTGINQIRSVFYGQG